MTTIAAPATPAFDAARAAVFAIGIGAPVATCLLVAGPAVALFRSKQKARAKRAFCCNGTGR